MRSRSMRRHHEKRIKRNRQFYWGRDLRQEPHSLGLVSRTPKPCNCVFCTNMRNIEGPTIQEKRQLGKVKRV